MNPVFLSASIPDPTRDPIYFATADIVAIRDAVVALVEVVLPETKLYFGGHPAITPMVRRVAQRLELIENIALFQSREYEKVFPPDTRFFSDLRLSNNLDEMRRAMLGTERFSAAFFIGGMEGIENEWNRVRQSPMQQGVPLFPVASTGGAALRLWNEDTEGRHSPPVREALRTDFNFVPLFRNLLMLGPMGARGDDLT